MDQKTVFYQLLEQHINSVSGKFQDKFCVTQESYDQIKEVLATGKGEKCQFGSYFKFWCKKNYRLEKIGSLNVVYCVKTSCPVVAKESMFETLVKCHERVGHSGRRKTWDEVKKNYAGIRFDVIPLFLSTCKQCNERRPAKNPPSGRPMIALGFLTRVQMDLIDFSSRPDGDYRYILHVRDHFSKYSWAFPLTSKRASEVAEKIVELFCTFGPAKILQSDNGREFTASVIEDIKKLRPDVIIIHGRPRHPQSQGLIERGNGDLQLKLGKWMDTNGENWSKGLKFVIHTINTSVSRITSKSPYEVVFGQTPRSDFHILEDAELHENQHVVWDRDQLIDSGEGSSMHKAVRLEAQKSYLKAVAAQRNRHNIQVTTFVKDYAVGDTVGIKIHSADRTNTDARLLPCKVMEVSVKNGKKFYRIYSASGILKNKFTGEELADMKNVTFPSLSSADPSNLEEVSLVQASRATTNWQASKKVHDVCQCKGSCITNRCCCKKRGIKCSTKCHINSMACQNKI